MQVVVNLFENPHELCRTVTVLPAKFSNEGEAVTRIIIVSEILHPITIIPAVKIHIAGSMLVLIERIQEILTNLKRNRDIMTKNSHPLIRSA